MLTLVAYYGKKSAALATLIKTHQQELTTRLGANFIPYELEQVHATIIGCEGTRDEQGIVSHWFTSLRGEMRYIDFVGLIKYLSQIPHLPLEIVFGGYQSAQNYRFLSRRQHPRDRSFTIQTTATQDPTNLQGIPVMLGWSMENNLITLAIDNLRRDCQQFNLLHKYHAKDSDLDNDLYLRLGTITGVNSNALTTVGEQMIYQMQQIPPTKVSLSQDDLAIVDYQELSLPTTSTQVHKLKSLRENPEIISTW